MKIRLLLLPVFFIYSFALSAQTYQLTTDVVDYVPLENSISLNNGEVFDDEEFIIPLDFSIDFFDNTLTTLMVSSNGALSDEGFNDYENNLTALLPYVNDFLIDRGFATGDSQSNISYLIEGDEGERILKVEWSNIGFDEDINYYNGNSFVNFQVWIFEIDGSIEYRYGDTFIEDSYIISYYGGGPLIGMIDGFNPDLEIFNEFVVLAGDPSSPSLVLLEEDFDFEYLDLLNGSPAPNTRYRFTLMDVSTNEITERSNQFSIYPNPASTVLSLVKSTDVEEIQSLTIYSNDGRLIKTITTDFSNMNVADLVSGVYHLNIVTEEGLAVKRFVKIDQ